MLKYGALFFLIFVIPSCSDDAFDRIKNALGNSAESKNEIGRFEFSKEVHDFGDITEGAVESTTFKFKNTGDYPLVISAAEGSCGCTVPEYPEKPIQPGEDGEILVTFNSEGRPGIIDKHVTLRANTIPEVKVLRIKGFVKSKNE